MLAKDGEQDAVGEVDVFGYRCAGSTDAARKRWAGGCAPCCLIGFERRGVVVRNTGQCGSEYGVPPSPPPGVTVRRAALVVLAACAALLTACSSAAPGQPSATSGSCIGSGCSSTAPNPSSYTRVPAATTTRAPTTTPPAPAMTTSQANAVRKAESYLAYQAFSRTGLIKQLQYEGFSAADATYAVDHVTVDWTEQADKKAAEYMRYQAFSRSGLIKQLQYEGFTADQAAHGAKSVGL